MNRRMIKEVARTLTYVILIMAVSACTVQNKFMVTPMGYEPEEYSANLVYVLPRDHIKVRVSFEKQVFVPGPYADYAMRLLGISEVKRNRSTAYVISNVELENYPEADREHLYSVNIIEGTPSLGILDRLEKDGLILRYRWYGDNTVQVEENPGNEYPGIPYPDVTMESNIEIRTETIYKTIITDTSFVQVPVQTEQLEQKTLQRKAQEAANFILELRSDRYFLSAGLMDPYPQDFELATALKKLDQLEREYLSLFLGKSYTISGYREFWVTPGNASAEQEFVLDEFSPRYGFVSTEDAELITLQIRPQDVTKSLRNLMPQAPEAEAINQIYFRVPEATEFLLKLGEKVIYRNRMPIFQSGALINTKVGE